MASFKQKQSMTSFDLAAIVSELREVIVGCRIGNIYQTSPLTFLLAIQPNNKLIIEVGRRIHLTRYVTEKPKFPSNFCMILRKHLRRGIIKKVETPGFERIIILTVASKGASYKLVFELFSKGNVILLNDDDKIFYASSYRKMRDRNIVRGETFSLPPPRGLDPTRISRQDLEELRGRKGDVVRALSNYLAIGGLYAEEILKRAEIDKKKTAKTLESMELDRIHIGTKNLVSNLSTNKQPHIVEDVDGRFIDVLPFPLALYKEYLIKKYQTFNEAADDYFTSLSFEAGKGEVQGEMRRQVEEQRRILKQQREGLRDFERASTEKQRIGDMIYAHARELEILSRFILEASKKRRSWDERFSEVKEKEVKTLQTDFLKSIDPKMGMFTVEIEDLRFELSFRKSVYENASRFYEEAKKARGKINGVKEAIAKTDKKIKVLEQLGVQTEKRLEKPEKRRKRRWFEKFHWTHSHEGFLIIGGRDASSNELLIKKHTNRDDIVFHADIPGAPFIVIKAEGKTPSEQTLEEAAQCAVSYSSAWRSGYTSLDAYWVKPEQVRKEAPSGEYLTRGAFMIYGQRNYIRNVPLRISIGLIRVNDQWMIIGGPPSPIASQTKYRVEIVPGRQSSGRLAKEIRRRLAEKVPTEFRTKILKLPIEEIQRFIPAGGGDVAFR